MKNQLCLLAIVAFSFLGCKNEPKNEIEEISPAVDNLESTAQEKTLSITPISHASMQLMFNGQKIYVDPVGNISSYELNEPVNLILLTDTHDDHFDPEIVRHLVGENTMIIAPSAVGKLLSEELLTKTKLLSNGEIFRVSGTGIEAVPMYNLPGSSEKFHPKGRGNGYILENGATRVYIAGDTGPIPEMRNLENIDVAFVPMNLPYTMSVAEAADAVLDFKPKKVYPYHYRDGNGFADVDEFRNLVTTNSEVEVVLLEWYPESN